MIEAVGRAPSRTVSEQPKPRKIGQAAPSKDSLHSIKTEKPQEMQSGLRISLDQKTTFLQILDYIPLLGNLKNLLDFILKIIWRPSEPSNLSPQSLNYFEHISQKSWIRTLIGIVPVIGNIFAAIMDSDRRGYVKSLIYSCEQGNTEAFRKLYHRGSPKQQEIAMECAFKASVHGLSGNSDQAQKSLLEVLQRGRPSHQKKVLSWLMNNIQNWGNYPRQMWYEKEQIPAELKARLLEIFVQSDLQTNDVLSNVDVLYRNMSGPDQEKVINAFCKAAEGNPEGFEKLKRYFGDSRPAQQKLILEWIFKQAANPSAPRYEEAWHFFEFDIHYLRGEQDFAKETVFDWVLKQAENSNPTIHEKAWQYLRYRLEDLSIENCKVILDLCVKLASSGNKALYAQAIRYLDHQYYLGAQERRRLAFDCYLAIAEKGDVEMMRRVAQEYHQKYKKDDAIHWFTRAANAGDIASMYKLGFLLNTEAALPWFEKAANLGHIESMLFLGDMYNMKDDLDRAAHWYKKAADLGNERAKIRLDHIRLGQESQRRSEQSRRAREDAQRGREEEFRRFFEERFRKAESSWQEERSNAQRAYANQDLAHFKNEFEKMGLEIADDITPAAFRSAVKQWMLKNHPDKVKPQEKEAAEVRFKAVGNLVGKFKDAKKKMGLAEWDYK